ncbi:TIGR02444 family protein [Catenovulum sp. SX2]|uniref:TIGR02444 family protein n=1 Tax=Catenovulum sp. SX2 TaxID=3398614 RepID=UPI003F828388
MTSTTTNPYWPIICELYANKQIQQQCLGWQDNYGANVNWLLLAAILQQQNHSYTQTTLEQTSQQLEEFSQQHTRLIRQCRYNWRSSEQNPNYQQLKQQLLKTELQFEQLEQQLILDSLNSANEQAEQVQQDEARSVPFDWLVEYHRLPKQQAEILMTQIRSLML